MNREGPPIESLTRRLAETPAEFLAEPRLGKSGEVHVAAVIADLLRMFGGDPDPREVAAYSADAGKRERNRLATALLLAWLLADDWFRHEKIDPDQISQVLAEASGDLAAQTASRAFTTDPDRREEMARVALARLGIRPAGESEEQAQDRLASLSASERQRVIAAARAAEQRARAIREALARKAAEESADKYTRE